ncbi:hypothetical protein BOTBODRAFT_170769 [Botryobasidium botryosum FD-172 SS1]|uniref:Mitochondrial distribution and morphology protein 35 n=1 Tax=Botryobasidium botryosum (strain FD-172 SS1) TaxID=930990 RepID=A0A067MT21_BOTB1|nr:hypothetical protein BOTBODRAFT_170769 [Botryobasidium botryosum FD-172 SS1]
MAESLSPSCTPLKHAYDACFNAWFEGYLEPVVASAPALRERRAREKADEYEARCGALWKNYRECVQKAVAEKGLSSMLEQARKDKPLVEPSYPDSEKKD